MKESRVRESTARVTAMKTQTDSEIRVDERFSIIIIFTGLRSED